MGTWQCTSQKKYNDTHHAIVKTTVMPLVLFKLRLKFSDFYHKQGSSTPTNLTGRVKIILLQMAGDIWFFTERDWSQEC